ALWLQITREPPPCALTRRRKRATRLQPSESLGAQGAATAPRPAGTRPLEQEGPRGLSRTVAEIHWLLAILVLLYLVFGGVREDPEEAAAVSAGVFFYAALLMTFRYAHFYPHETRWQIALATARVILFFTCGLWHPHRPAPP